MKSVEKAVLEALKAEGKNQEANKACLEFIKANFIVPVEKSENKNEPKVLFLHEKNEIFFPVFTDIKYLELWANDIRDSIDLLHLSGVDLLKGVGDTVTICFNLGSPLYKEFNPSEIARMRSMVLKIFKN